MSEVLVLVPPAVALSARVFGGLLFGAAVVSKLRHHVAFVGVVDNYRLVPTVLAPTAAWLVIAAEAIVAASLLAGWPFAVGALGAIGLLLAFALAMAINLLRGRSDIDCGCFQSALRQHLSWWLVARNLLASVLMASLLTPFVSDLAPLEIIDGLCAGIGLFAVVRAFEALLALRASAKSLQQRFA